MQTEMDHSRDQIHKDFRRNISLKHQHSRRVVTAGDAASGHDRIRVPAAAHDMDEAWGRACSTTYFLPYCKSGRRNNAAEWKVDGLRLWIEVGAQTATTQTERGRSEAMMAARRCSKDCGSATAPDGDKGRCKRKWTTVAIRSTRTFAVTSR